MMRKILLLSVLLSTLALFGCASVPMASLKADAEAKQFPAPPESKAGLYIYRNTFIGQGLKKTLSLDGTEIGETANRVYFYTLLNPGEHLLSTESEFSDNSMTIEVEAGRNYFVEQYIKWGVFIGGANLEMKSEAEGKEAVLECRLARQFGQPAATDPATEK